MATPVFHITHVANLASMAEHGLLCDSSVVDLGEPPRSIAYVGIKAIRAATEVLCGPGGTLADYVPFYFAPRSPMLYTIHRGNVPGAEGEQHNIVHMVFSADELFEAYECVFTDGHAIMGLSNFYDDLAHLDQIDWEVMKAQYWSQDGTGEMRRRRQAEFLVHGHVPWSMVRAIGVHDAKVAGRVAKALSGVSHCPEVRVKPEWYY